MKKRTAKTEKKAGEAGTRWSKRRRRTNMDINTSSSFASNTCQVHAWSSSGAAWSAPSRVHGAPGKALLACPMPLESAPSYYESSQVPMCV